jgi:hypothetical protein
MTNRIGVAAVFLVGCAVGGASSQLVVPKASAQQAAMLTKWEYQCNMQDLDDAATVANRLGGQAWEMVGLSYRAGGDLATCFKRPKM